MSGDGKFVGGFLTGAIFGSIVGGVLTVAWRKNLSQENGSILPNSKRDVRLRKQGLNPRRNLEEQIDQIRSTMDDMNEQLGAVIEQSTAAAAGAEKSQIEQ